jgi:hypothetical protein
MCYEHANQGCIAEIEAELAETEAAERARANVQRRLTDVLRRIGNIDPSRLDLVARSRTDPGSEILRTKAGAMKDRSLATGPRMP